MIFIKTLSCKTPLLRRWMSKHCFYSTFKLDREKVQHHSDPWHFCDEWNKRHSCWQLGIGKESLLVACRLWWPWFLLSSPTPLTPNMLQHVQRCLSHHYFYYFLNLLVSRLHIITRSEKWVWLHRTHHCTLYKMNMAYLPYQMMLLSVLFCSVQFVAICHFHSEKQIQMESFEIFWLLMLGATHNPHFNFKTLQQ